MSERDHADPSAARDEGVPRRVDAMHRREPAAIDLLRRAEVEPARPLDATLRHALEGHLGHDFGRVRVHDGPASAAAAERIGARAYTLGRDIHLGAEAWPLAGSERERLLAHEAVHTAQQGGVPVALDGSLAVSRPGDPAESDAQRIATSLASPAPASRSLALRDGLRGRSPAPLRAVAPQVQRDLSGKHKVGGGEFAVDLKTESHPGSKNGMSGTIKFRAGDKAPDSTSIRLLQVAKDLDLDTGKDYVWTGAEANRNKLMTTADASRGVEGGWMVDHSAAKAAPRKAKGDAAVSPYYRDYWPNAKSSQDGSKKGKTIKEASLWDYPGSAGKRAFSFETVAKAADTGHVYGTLMWGFTISDPAKGTVEKERAVGRDVTLLTTDIAIEKFNKFYRNPGASTAP